MYNYYMQLIIIYDKTFVINNINDCTYILDIKSTIEKLYSIPIKSQSLQYSGKILLNEKIISDYNIKNNSFIFLITHLNGGNVPGFPNIGHLIILLSISTLMLLLSYYFFYTMLSSLDAIENQKTCKSLIEINKELNSESIFEPMLQYIRNKTKKPMEKSMETSLTKITDSKTTFSSKKKRKRSSGGMRALDNMQDFLYTLSSMFYSSIVVIILTIYGYTLFCNEGLSNLLLVGSLASLVIMFLVFYVLYKLIKDQIINVYEATYWSTIIFAIVGSLLVIATFILPKATNTTMMHWTTYLYPIGIMVTVTLQFYITNRTNWSIYIKVITFLAMIVSFIFIPYIVAYVYNIYKMCN